MRQLLALALVFCGSLAFAACAQGTADGIHSHVDAASGGTPDTNFNSTIDAAPFDQPDAFVDPPDAFVDMTPDAGTTGNGFCNGDPDCNTGAGECCFTLGQPPGICVPNQSPIPGICLP